MPSNALAMMPNELELWQFVSLRLSSAQPVMLLVVAESAGSSPGRAGYKIAVAADGKLCGSIGGGVMEVNLVEQSRAILRAASEPGAVATGFQNAVIVEQDHKKNARNPSGMICSGRQTVIFRLLTPENTKSVTAIVKAFETGTPLAATLTSTELEVGPTEVGTLDFYFERRGDHDFIYKEKLALRNDLSIVGGGHCALALSELMSRLDFRISIFDDRPDLNTIEKNRFADQITIIEGYDTIGELIASGPNTYVVVMTLGYNSDETVIRGLIAKHFKYFGVLGSKAKMKTLLRNLEKKGISKERLARIRTPVGLPIKSRTPEEIAVSIAGEIIAVKNG